jgi:hypothetical protein
MHLFVRQLDGLDDQTSAMYTWRFYLLETLAQVKCFALCSELSEGKEITRSIFEYVMFRALPCPHLHPHGHDAVIETGFLTWPSLCVTCRPRSLFFESVSESSNIKMRSYMADILVSLIEEADAIDTAVLDAVMTHLLPTIKVCMPRTTCPFVEYGIGPPPRGMRQCSLAR